MAATAELGCDSNVDTPGFVDAAALVGSRDGRVDRASRRQDEAVSGEAAAAAQHTSGRGRGFRVRGCARRCARLGIQSSETGVGARTSTT